MRHAAQATAAMPFAAGGMGGGGNAMDVFGGQALRAWVDATTQVQAETAAFWTGRVNKDIAALTALAQCTTPTAAADMQMRYAREAWADFEAEGRRLMRIVSDAGAFTLPGLPGATSATHD